MKIKSDAIPPLDAPPCSESSSTDHRGILVGNRGQVSAPASGAPDSNPARGAGDD